VEKGAVLAEIETDKATVEVESTFTGTVRKHLVEEGTIVPVNTPLPLSERGMSRLTLTPCWVEVLLPKLKNHHRNP